MNSVGSLQVPLGHAWTVHLSNDWDVLGPFPIQAREQHYLSPSFPLNLSEPIDLTKPLPSAYANGGRVSWNKTQSTDDGELNVSFPEIRWEALRATEGWAGLQHHSVLRTSITLYPPQSSIHGGSGLPPHLLVDLEQGSFFTILPSEEERRSNDVVPQWYSGNIYALERALPQTVQLPQPPHTTAPTKYDIFVSGDYEIRLFGDPRLTGTEMPVLKMSLVVTVEPEESSVMPVPSHNVICDFVDGIAFGSALGIGLRSVSGWATVTHAVLFGGTESALFLDLVQETTLAPSQTRIIPIKLTQVIPSYLPELHVDLTVVLDTNISTVISVVLPVTHLPHWGVSDSQPIKATYFSAGSMATGFVVLPPKEPNHGEPRASLLALHGAGVDIFAQSFWAHSLPRQKHSWVVIPSGRTSWGLDWHGPSAQNAWDSLDALTDILDAHDPWHAWMRKRNSRVVILGHSNGGQGAWYAASRYPDRVLAVVPAAGYIKSQAYVPLTQSRSAHFIDPLLRAILDTSLTPDDNDLFLSNLVDTPILAIHGGDDNNVPTWHSREAVDIIETWSGSSANITFKEDPGQPHWYSSVLDNPEVQGFLDSLLEAPSNVAGSLKSFTLTVSIPHESGGLQGWRIESLLVPGRLGRMHVASEGSIATVKTSNVHSFLIDLSSSGILDLVVDGTRVPLVRNATGMIRFTTTAVGWAPDLITAATAFLQISGRIQAILVSAGPLLIVIPDEPSLHALGVALRIVHDLDTYHKLDATIVRSSEALRRARDDSLGSGNIVVVGTTNMTFLQWTLRQEKTAFRLENSLLKLKGRSFDQPSMGVVFLHPHPTNLAGNVLVISGTDGSGLERAARLFPIRTGISVPDWIAIGSNADNMGAAGVTAAGVWGREWAWNEPVSWLD